MKQLKDFHKMQKACFHAMVIETTAETDFSTRIISLSIRSCMESLILLCIDPVSSFTVRNRYIMLCGVHGVTLQPAQAEQSNTAAIASVGAIAKV